MHKKFVKKWLVVFSAFLIISGIYLFISLYVYPSHNKKTFMQIPLQTEIDSDFFFLEVLIENKPFSLLLDTGAATLFNLQQPSLDSIKNKREINSSLWFDVNGNEYSSSQFVVDGIKLGGFTINKACIKLEPEEYTLNGGFIKGKGHVGNKPKTRKEIEKQLGSMGIKMLRAHDYWLIDFPKKELLAVRDLNEFKRDCRLAYSNFSIGELDTWNELLILHMETDFGMKSFILDTGAEITIMRRPNLEFEALEFTETQKFSFNNHHFGPQKILLFDLPKQWEIDGFIGMDFLKDRAILLDFKNKQVYIGPKESNKLSSIKN